MSYAYKNRKKRIKKLCWSLARVQKKEQGKKNG